MSRARVMQPSKSSPDRFMPATGVMQRRSKTREPARDIVPQVAHDVLNSPGRPLHSGVRAFMEPRFGHDFLQSSLGPVTAHRPQARLTVNQPGDQYEQEADRVAEQIVQMPQASAPLPETGYDLSRVRIHNDSRAAAAAQALNAQAFTVGHHIVFGAGQYLPGTAPGNRLLAHELTHVVQQTAPMARTDCAQRALVKHRVGHSQIQGRWQLDQTISNTGLEALSTRGNASAIHSSTENSVFGYARGYQTQGFWQQEIGGQAQVAKWVTKHLVFRNNGQDNDFLQLTLTASLGGNAKAEDMQHARAGGVVGGRITLRTAANPTPSDEELFSTIHDGGISTASMGDLAEIDANIQLGEHGSVRVTFPLKRVQQGALATFSESINRLRDISSAIDEVDVFLVARVEADADIETSLTGVSPWISPDENIAQVNAGFNVTWQNRPSPQSRRSGADVGSATAVRSGDSAPVDLHAFGNTTKPRDPRRGVDIQPDGDDYVGPTNPPTGASTFGDVDHAPLTGHYHQISRGTGLGGDLKVIADGSDVGGTHPPTHHMIFPGVRMLFPDYVNKFQRLPWVYDGRKR